MKMIKKAIFNYHMLIALGVSIFILLFEMIFNMMVFDTYMSGYKSSVLKTVGSVYALSIYMVVAGMFPQLPYSFSMAEEKRNGLLRFELIRYGYRSFFRKKIISIGLSGMITTLVPYSIVVIIANICGENYIDDDVRRVMENLVWRPFIKMQNGGTIILFLKGVLIALFGIFWAELAFLISLCVKNRYIAFILPFILYMFLHVATIEEGVLMYINPKFMIRYDEEYGAPLFLPFIAYGMYILLTVLISKLLLRRMIKNGDF